MKILHIIDHLGLGGAQSVVKGIFEARPKNENLFLFSLRKREITIEIAHKNVIIHDSSSKYSLGPINDLIDLISKKNIEVLHCHLFRSQYIGYLLKKRYFPKLKLIFHEHGEIFEGHFIYNIFMRFSQGLVNKVIAVSRATKQELVIRSKMDPEKIVILPNFVNLSKKTFTKNRALFTLGFVGRLSKIKGCDIFIKSLKNLNFKYNVIIAGDGPDKNKLINLSKDLGLIEKIDFLGYVKDPSIVYSMLDICIIPSRNESFGISAVEAQSMNVPVIASKLGGLKEVIKDKKSGLLFNKGDVEDLAKKINLLYYNEKLRGDLAKYGFKESKKYSLKSYKLKLMKIYNEL